MTPENFCLLERDDSMEYLAKRVVAMFGQTPDFHHIFPMELISEAKIRCNIREK